MEIYFLILAAVSTLALVALVGIYANFERYRKRWWVASMRNMDWEYVAKKVVPDADRQEHFKLQMELDIRRMRREKLGRDLEDVAAEMGGK